MAYVHGTVNQISKIYLQNEKRYNYTTPKTFLEYIFLYRKLLVDKNGEFAQRIQRLQSGMAKLAECARQVDTLKVRICVESNKNKKTVWPARNLKHNYKYLLKHLGFQLNANCINRVGVRFGP